MIDTKKIRNKHGFTLVEIIVVLVILAILAAVAIPSVLGYVDEAKKAGVKIMGTGRSDFPNQINNVIAFPGIFRGALDVRASQITENMNLKNNQFLNITTHYLQIFLIKRQQQIQLEECLIL